MWLRGGLVGLVVLALVLPPVIDGVNGAAKSKSRCHITRVIDGDTVKIECPDSGTTSGRILGYDAPEKNARCVSEFVQATRATWVLRWGLWQARTIEIRRNGKDRYDRDLILLRVNGSNVAAAMIGKGLARAYGGGRRGSWCQEAMF